MATSSELIETVSRVTGAPDDVVAGHDQRLIDMGMRFPKLRGMREPHMMPVDAANLVLATLASALDGGEETRHFPQATASLAADIQRCMDRLRLHDEYDYFLDRDSGSVRLSRRSIVSIASLLSGEELPDNSLSLSYLYNGERPPPYQLKYRHGYGAKKQILDAIAHGIPDHIIAENHGVSPGYIRHLKEGPDANAGRDAEIVEKYKSGTRIRELAQEYGVTKQRISMIALEGGAVSRRKQKSKEQDQS